MRAKTILRISLVAFLVAVTSLTRAQQKEKCGPYTVDQAALNKALAFEKQNQNNKLEGASPVVVRVYFRVCEPDGGLLFDVTEDQIATDFDHLVRAYTSDNICFVNCGHDYIQSSALDTFNTGSNSSTIFYPYGIQNCITIFYIDKLGGTNGSNGGGFSGITYGVPSAWSIVEKDYIGQGTLEHEVGHCFGLWHTFDYKNSHKLEDINGDNSTTAADLVSDTPADPYAFAAEDNTGCFSTVDNAGCTYNGTCTDNNLAGNYSPPYTNVMSYWCQGFYPTGTLTTGQFTRVSSFLSTAAVLQITESANTVTEGPNVSVGSGYLMNSAITTLTTSGTVTLSSTSKTTFGGTTVFLEPGFHATPSDGGFFFARTEACVPLSPRMEPSDDGEVDHAAPSQNVEASLLAYPNPTSFETTLSFNLNEDEPQSQLQIYDINLKLVSQSDYGELRGGKQNLQVDLNNLFSGVYLLVLKFSSSQLSTKIVLEK